MSVSDNVFIDNLLATSAQEGAIILRDGSGSTRSLWRRIMDFFCCTSYSHDFNLCVERLQNVITREPFTDLSIECKFTILSRISAVKSKVFTLNNVIEPSLERALFQDVSKEDLIHLANNIIERNIPGTGLHKNNSYSTERDLALLERVLKHPLLNTDEDSFYRFFSLYQNLLASHTPDLIFSRVKFCHKCLPLNTLFFNEMKRRIPNSTQDKLGVYRRLSNKYFQSVSGFWHIYDRKTYLKQHIEFPQDTNSVTNTISQLNTLHFLDGEPSRNRIKSALEVLKEELEKNPDEARYTLYELDAYLEKSVFNKGLMPQDFHITQLRCLEGIFELCNTHISKVDYELKRDLKIKLANLPCEKRDNYPNVFLGKEEQAQILIMNLIKKENMVVEDIINGNIQLYKDNAKKLAKFTCSNSPLEFRHKEMLQKFFQKTFPDSSFDWNDQVALEKTLNQALKSRLKKNGRALKRLNYIAKTKAVFKQQIKDNKIAIPYWYHASKSHKEIWATQSILVTHRGYTGAWTSSIPQSGKGKDYCPDATYRSLPTFYYGCTTFAFTDQITEHSCSVSIKAKMNHRRWRGRQSPIEFSEESNGLPLIAAHNRWCSKIKSELRSMVNGQIPVISIDRLHFLRRTIHETLGHPNISLKWWG